MIASDCVLPAEWNTRCSLKKFQPYKIWEFDRCQIPAVAHSGRDFFMSKLHTHADGEAVKGVHQGDGEGQIAYLNRVKLFC